MAEDTGPFRIGEKVSVPHTDKFYEAKVLKAEYRDEGQGGMWFYFLHYTGWNKKYDEWVEETGIQHAPQQDDRPHIKKPTTEKLVKKRRLGDIQGELADEGSAQLDVDIPATLKKQLLDEYEAVVEWGKLTPLPRTPNVHQVLQRYVHNAAHLRGTSDVEDDVALGVRSYFDKALSHCLLYSNEQEQAAEALAGSKCPSFVYGAEHLLRLFVKLPELMPVNEGNAATIHMKVQDVLSFLRDNHRELFLSKSEYSDSKQA